MASVPRTPKSVGEIESFITMLTAACEDASVHARLERLLSMPDPKRQAVVRAWVNDLLIAQAPGRFRAGDRLPARRPRGGKNL